MLDSLATPAGVRANGAKARAILSRARQELGGIESRLQGIAPPASNFAPIKPAAMIADLRDQNRKLVALLADYEALVLAAEKGDAETHQRLAPKVASGAFFLMDGMRLTFRNRQAAIPPNRSAHQGVGVAIELYRAMAASGRAWYNARLARQPDQAAATFKAEIAGMAGKLRAMGREGRANIDRERAELERVANGATAQEAQMIARFRSAIAERGKLFDVGDEIALWAEKNQSVTAAQLAADTNPRLLDQLVPLELRFQSIAASEAALASGKRP
jgi:hypothetical protein